MCGTRASCCPCASRNSNRVLSNLFGTTFPILLYIVVRVALIVALCGLAATQNEDMRCVRALPWLLSVSVWHKGFLLLTRFVFANPECFGDFLSCETHLMVLFGLRTFIYCLALIGLHYLALFGRHMFTYYLVLFGLCTFIYSLFLLDHCVITYCLVVFGLRSFCYSLAFGRVLCVWPCSAHLRSLVGLRVLGDFLC